MSKFESIFSICNATCRQKNCEHFKYELPPVSKIFCKHFQEAMPPGGFICSYFLIRNATFQQKSHAYSTRTVNSRQSFTPFSICSVDLHAFPSQNAMAPLCEVCQEIFKHFCKNFLCGEGEKKGDSDGRRGRGAGNLFFTTLSCITILQLVNVTLDQLRRKMNSFNPILQTWFALQRQNAENLKQIFPEKEYRGLSPNFHIHVSVNELYISTMGLPFLLEEICGPILGIYKSLTDT